MEYLVAAVPKSESELAVMLSLLTAHDIPNFVQNRGFGSLYPGMQMHIFNTQRIMVPAHHISDATELLSVLLDGATESEQKWRLSLGDRLRVLAELLLGGWAIPVRRRSFDIKEHEHEESS